MTKREAEEKLSRYDQGQLLSFYDSLNESSRENLLNQIDQLDLSVLNVWKEEKTKGISRGTFFPLGALTIDEIAKKRDLYQAVGQKALREGKVAALILAGGQGTRLGYDHPKGTYNIGVTHPLYIFECLIQNLQDVVKEVGVPIPLYIMTSRKNHDETVRFLQEHSFFGYPADSVRFFIQQMAPSVDYSGHIYLEAKDRISLSPNGNGGWFTSLKEAGLADQMERDGVEWITVCAVDNVCQRINDPVFVGAVIESGCECGAKVVRKASPDEKVGVLCLEDGRPSIVEYYEMTDDMIHLKDAAGNLLYNFGVILNYMFRLDSLERIAGRNLPLHIVEKKIPYIDAEGNLVKPDKPNGYKFEKLVLDMIHMMDSCCAYEVCREREFAPVKNLHGVDSVDTARELLRKNGVEL